MTESPESLRQQLQSPLRTRDNGGGGSSSTLLVWASRCPSTQPRHLQLPHRPPNARRRLTPHRLPYLRLGSSQPRSSPLPAIKHGQRRNYEFRQGPRDPAAVFPGADGSRSSVVRSNRKRFRLPAGRAKRRGPGRPRGSACHRVGQRQG